ncbi:PREDICTED: ninein-like protein isoform X3 [Branchiostoma belcheri]|uniref:Ninein-like protein isoform X3 n=1 Tax=Branchiostoma belcheri TaxID=7741 RepID=A0A6P4Z7R0_BRABE|nr:PREDICTED: ninein-like protein isoform X3 [Branchiostoma belcheri]
MDEGEQDVYVAQLKEVFDSCDTTGTGYLDRAELRELCHRLQLDDQADNLTKQLLGKDPNNRVSFDEFKEGFVAVLSHSVDELDTTEEDFSLIEDIVPEEVEPKYVKGKKKYGRRSKPDFLDSEDDVSRSESHPTPAKKVREERRTTLRERTSSMASIQSLESDDGKKKPPSTGDSDKEHERTFEAEGTGLLKTGTMDDAYTPSRGAMMSPTDEDRQEEIRQIWEELGVGHSGFLNKAELDLVCKHIGLDEMNDEELSHLFQTLDKDGDGKISLQELLNGLFKYSSSPSPTPSPTRGLMAAERRRLARSMTLDESLARVATPLVGINLFSALDSEGTGYVQAEEIVNLWQEEGIQSPMEVLEDLGFELGGKVNITELSMELEHELYAIPDDNKVYHAALTSYRSEIRHLKSDLDQAYKERDKVQGDLEAANLRVNKLVQEVDDRHAGMERTSENRLRTTEKRYEEKIERLQAEIQKEREFITQQAAKQKGKLEHEIDNLLEEQKRLHEKLSIAHQERGDLEKELLEMTERLVELQKTNDRLSKDNEAYSDLQLRFADIESRRDSLKMQQEVDIVQHIKDLEAINRELRDKNDELVLEIEELRSQLTGRHVRRRGNKDKVGRTGSILSDYQKPTVVRRRGKHTTSSDNESETDEGPSGRTKRRLPTPKRDTTSSQEDDGSRLSASPNQLTPAHSPSRVLHAENVSELRDQFERERREIEQAYKFEIAELEEKKAELEKGLVELQEKHESEKNEMEQKFALDKAGLRDRLEAEFKEDLEIRIAETRTQLLKEKDMGASELMTQHATELQTKLEDQRRDLEQKFDKEKSNMEQKHHLEVNALQAGFDKEVNEMINSHRKEMEQLENKHRKEKEAVQEAKEDMEKKFAREKKELSKNSERDRQNLMNTLDKDKAELCQTYTQERNQMEQQFQTEMQALQKQHQKELDTLRKNFELEKVQLEKSVSSDTREKAEAEFRKEKEKLTRGFEDERKKLNQEREKVEKRATKEKDDLQKRVAKLEDQLDSKEQEKEREKHEGKQQKTKVEELKSETSALQQQLNSLQREKDRAEAEHNREVEKLQKTFDREREELANKTATLEGLLKNKDSDLEEAWQYRKRAEETEAINANLHREKQRMETELQDEIDLVKKSSERRQDDLQYQIQQLEGQLQRKEQEKEDEKEYRQKELQREKERVEAHFTQQMERLKRVFDEERQVFANQKGALERQVAEKEREKEAEKQFRNRVQELNAQNTGLQRDNQRLEVTLADLRSELEAARREKEEMLVMVKQEQEEAMAAINNLDKAKLNLLEEQKETLNKELQEVKDKLLKANAELMLGKSQQDRELKHVREQHDMELEKVRAESQGKVAPEELNSARLQVIEKERRCRELEVALEQRSTETNKLLMTAQQGHEKTVAKLKQDKEELDNKLAKMHTVLNEQTNKLKEQLSKTCRSDLLVKDLYVENAQLMKALQVTEQRQKEAERSSHLLAEKNLALVRVLRKVCPAVI